MHCSGLGGGLLSVDQTLAMVDDWERRMIMGELHARVYDAPTRQSSAGRDRRNSCQNAATLLLTSALFAPLDVV